MEDTNAQKSKKIENWSEDEVLDFISKHFSDEVASKFKGKPSYSSTGEKDEHSLSKESAAAILSVAFNAISVRYITRGLLSSASKTLKLGLKTTLSKEECVVPVATALIKQGSFKIGSSEKVTREDVSKLKSF